MSIDRACIPLTLFMRHGCHLCEDMEQIIHELLEPGSFSLTLVDIDAQADLKARFNEWVPVLMHADQEICHHFLDLKALQTAQAGYNTTTGG